MKKHFFLIFIKKYAKFLNLTFEVMTMKKILIVGFLSVGLIGTAFANDLSGTYKCHINDQIDGTFQEILKVKNNPQASLPKQGYMSYDLEFAEVGTSNKYIGFAAASGDDVAMYFESPDKNMNDRGVGIASVSTKHKKITIKKFYYEPAYEGKSNYGFEECISDK